MADIFEQSCVVVNGHIPREISQAVAAALKRVEGKRIIVSLRKHVQKRSHKQNSFYWGVVIPLIHEMFTEAGNDATPEDVHDFLKQYVGGDQFVRIFITPDGKRKAVVRSSTTLTTKDWEDWIERIRAWAAGFGVIVPLPNESLIHQGE